LANHSALVFGMGTESPSSCLKSLLNGLLRLGHKIDGISPLATASQCALRAVNSLRINNLAAMGRNVAKPLKRVKIFLHNDLTC